jgi:hypothetical protein
MDWRQALELTLSRALKSILQGTPPIDGPAEISQLAVSPGIQAETPAGVGELGRLARVLAAAWARRRAPLVGGMEHQATTPRTEHQATTRRNEDQTSTIVVGVFQRQANTERFDSRLFDVLVDQAITLFERFIVGDRWEGFRFRCPLLYFWTDKNRDFFWKKPDHHAICIQPEDDLELLAKLETLPEDPVGKVLQFSTVSWPEQISKDQILRNNNNIRFVCKILGDGDWATWLKCYFPEYRHSCIFCEYKPICFGPEPFPQDATQAYPAIYKRRDL